MDAEIENEGEMTRPFNEKMDAEIGRTHNVLDHGFIRVVDYMGDDKAIVQAARVSYGTGTKTVREDRGLIRYLMRHRHSTPFEMCELKLHVKLPIFVARQWIRHRTANVNEASARYSILDREFYIPDVDDIQPQSLDNKQGRAGVLPEDVRFAMRETIRQQSEGSYQLYEELHTGWPWFNEDGDQYVIPGRCGADPDAEREVLDGREPHTGKHGMARELARMVVPPNVYTQWYWKVDLHNLLRFLSLRADPHAQKEIRDYAEVICDLVRQWCPWTFEAFEDYVMGAHTFSRIEMEALRKLLADRVELGVPRPDGVGEREHRAFEKALGVPEDAYE
jgi:thymidylate synthase (FAD)